MSAILAKSRENEFSGLRKSWGVSSVAHKKGPIPMSDARCPMPDDRLLIFDPELEQDCGGMHVTVGHLPYSLP